MWFFYIFSSLFHAPVGGESETRKHKVSNNFYTGITSFLQIRHDFQDTEMVITNYSHFDL